MTATPHDQPIVRIDGVRKQYGDLEVLKGIDLDVQVGEVVALLGPSGSGKSTLLRCINHLETIDGGIIAVNNEVIGYEPYRGRLREMTKSRVAQQRTGIGMVFQSFNLFPHLTALENIVVGPVKVQGRPRAEVVREAEALLAQVGLSARVGAYPEQLSGGQQQRVAIARALAMKPAVMLFDEPTSALDPELVSGVLSVIRQVAETGMTLIIVTHEVGFAREVADRVAFMEDGRVVELGPAREVIGNPRNERTRQFLRTFH